MPSSTTMKRMARKRFRMREVNRAHPPFKMRGPPEKPDQPERFPYNSVFRFVASAQEGARLEHATLIFRYCLWKCSRARLPCFRRDSVGDRSRDPTEQALRRIL